MDDNQKISLPWRLVALDIVGAILAATGIYLYVSESRGTLYIAVGLALMLPLVIHLLVPSAKRSEKIGSNKDG